MCAYVSFVFKNTCLSLHETAPEDIQGVANRSGVHKGTQKTLKNQTTAVTKNINETKTEYLFFKLSHRGVFSIPLILVNRLEEFSISEIEFSGNEKMVKYRGSLLPLIDLNQYLGHKIETDSNNDKKLSVIVSHTIAQPIHG